MIIISQREKRVENMNINFKYKVIGITAIFLILIAAGVIYYINSFTTSTITVYKDTVEDKTIKTGIVTAYTTPVKAAQSGEALYACEEGKLITPYSKIATVYSGELDEESRDKLRALNDKIVFSEAAKTSKANITGDIASISRDINNAFLSVVTETNENNYKNVYKLKNEITAYNKKLMELKGEKVEVSEINIQDEINKVERGLNFTKKVYTSPVNGMFSTKVSNFDELINPDIAMKLNVDEYNKLYSTDPVNCNTVEEGRSFCKIINNYEWYIVSKFTKEEIDKLKVGSFVELRVINCSDLKVSGTVSYISEYKGNEAVVVVKSTKNLDNVWTSNKVEFELIKSTKTGLKIPSASVIEKDGKQGVYVIKDSVYKFIEIEPVLYGENYILIKDKGVDEASERVNVILYDFVVVNPKNITEGAIAN